MAKIPLFLPQRWHSPPLPLPPVSSPLFGGKNGRGGGSTLPEGGGVGGGYGNGGGNGGDVEVVIAVALVVAVAVGVEVALCGRGRSHGDYGCSCDGSCGGSCGG